MIISDSRHPLDRDSLVTWSRRERVTPAATFDEAFDEARLGAARVIVTDLDEWPPGAARQVARALTTGAESAAILLRTDLSRRALMELPLLAASPALQRARISFRSYERLDDCLGHAPSDLPECATFEILQAIDALVPTETRHVVIATVVMCRKEVGRAQIGAQLGIGKEKLRAAYDECGFPPFPDLNAELLCAHGLAGAEHGASEQACAEWAGFDDVSALDKYLKYHFARDFEKLRKEHGLAAQVDRIVAWLRAS